MGIAILHTLHVFHIGDVVRKLRQERTLTLVQLQALSGVDKGTLSDLERGVGDPRKSTLERVAGAFEMTVGQLYELLDSTNRKAGLGRHEAELTEIDVSNYTPNDIPVIAEGEASPQGYLFWTDEGVLKAEVEDRISRPYDVKDPRAYGVRVRGDSMVPAYKPGTMLVVSPNTPVKSGDEVYVQLQTGERLLKVAHRQGKGWVLESINPAYPPRFVSDEEVGAIHPILWSRKKR